MYRVDFVDMLNYAIVHHSLLFSDGLDDISISGEKIAGSDYFAREPQRLEFTCLRDDWLENNIFDGDNEQIRNISNYEIRLYEDDTLRFHGIIDTSFCSYTAKTFEMKFTCYDKLRLLVKFSDLKNLYALVGGYSPLYCLGYFLQKIESKIANRVPYNSSGFSHSYLNKQIIDAEVLKIDWKQIIEGFGETSPQSATFGFKVTDYGCRLVLLLYRSFYDSYAWTAKVYACEWHFYNTICPFLVENTIIDIITPEFVDDNEFNQYLNSLWVNFAGPVPVNITTSEGAYATTFDSSNDLDVSSCPEYKSVFFSGNAIPKNLHPKGFYDHNDEQTELLPVLKTALLLHNLTVRANAEGVLRLQDKDTTVGTTIIIDDADVVEFEEKRQSGEKVDVSPLDILMGDTTLLKEVIEDHFEEYLSWKWELSVAIDKLDKYNIQLFNGLLIRGSEYRVIELRRDRIKDEHEIVAWRVN